MSACVLSSQRQGLGCITPWGPSKLFEADAGFLSCQCHCQTPGRQNPPEAPPSTSRTGENGHTCLIECDHVLFWVIGLWLRTAGMAGWFWISKQSQKSLFIWHCCRLGCCHAFSCRSWAPGVECLPNETAGEAGAAGWRQTGVTSGPARNMPQFCLQPADLRVLKWME